MTWVALAYYGTFFAFQSILPSMICAMICGVGVMSIGVNIMHDGNHGAVSDKAWVSHLYGLGLDFIGASSFIWKYQHNVGHHQHPNIAEHDPDIGFGSKILRLNPYQEWKPQHRFQHIYLPMLYGFHIMKWHLNDFLTLSRGRVFNTRLGPLSYRDYLTFFRGKGTFLRNVHGLPNVSQSQQFLVLLFGGTSCRILGKSYVCSWTSHGRY